MSDDELRSHLPKASPAALPSPTLRDLLAVLFRQWKVALIVFGTTIGLAVTYWSVAPAYQAHMQLLLRRERADPIVTPNASGPFQISRAEVTEEDLNSEVELLRDESLLRIAVETNGLEAHSLLGRFGLRRDDPEQMIARGVRKLSGQLRAEPIRKSNLIRVTYEASDPALASRVLNTLASSYVEQHTRVHRPTGQFQFFSQQASESKSRLETAQGKFVNYSRSGGVVSAALERDNALQRCGELESGYRQIRIARADVERRIEALEKQLRLFPQRSTATIHLAENPQLLETLKARLLELELKRTELLKMYEPTYRLVREINEQIEQASASIAAEKNAPLRDETSEKDPNYEWAKAEMEKARVEQSALSAREVASASELLAARAEAARRLGEAAVQQQDLLREMKSAEDTYLLYARKSEEARVGDALDERGILNVTLVEAPVAPVLPQHSVWMMVFTSVLAAGSAGTAASFIADYLDPAVRTPADVVACLRVPVLASLPREVA